MPIMNADIQRDQPNRERFRAIESLLQAQKLEAAGTIAAGIAHDFNNLISAIRGFASLAMMQMDPKDPAYNDLKQIQATVDRAGDMTTQIFQFSRKQSEQAKLLNINETVECTLEAVRCLIGPDINIGMNLQKAIWMVSAEKMKIEQVILSTGTEIT
jgi:C4-dicarboxylate-specific signal transduction histidine kinase